MTFLGLRIFLLARWACLLGVVGGTFGCVSHGSVNVTWDVAIVEDGDRFEHREAE